MSSDATKPARGAPPAPQTADGSRSEKGDDSVHDRTTKVPSLPAQGFADRMMKGAEPSAPPAADEPPTKPQAKVGTSWSAQTRPDATSSFPPPTPRNSVPRLSLYPSAPGSTPLGLAEVSAQDVELASPPQMTTKSESVPPLPSLDEAAQRMQACYEVGDFSGALSAAEVLLEHDPEDVEANRYAQSCRDVLTQMFSARLAPLDRVVRVAISQEQIRWLSLDHKSGFLLSLVDGNCSIEELLDVSGMPRLDALRILLTLSQQKVIALT
jgi:hypothetical protein